MKNLLLKLTGSFLSIVVLTFGVLGVSQAALPTAATTAFTTLSTDALALVDLAWTAAIPIAIAFIILKLFKKAAGSAA